MSQDNVVIKPVDYGDQREAEALRRLMQHYASGPMGGGKPLDEVVLKVLPQALAEVPGAYSLLAWSGEEAVGLVNCFPGFSTFRCQPLLNIHDLVVEERYRGRGIGRQLLQVVEQEALARGCCKVTLEVLEGNHVAKRLYQQCGFDSYELDPETGKALFFEKNLSEG